MLLVALMFVGGCAGSTSGSMKVMRMVVGLKSAFREVRLNFSPSTVAAVFVGGKAVPEGVVRSVAGFFILYLTSWGLGTVLLSLDGPSLVTAATAAAATLGNVGPGLEAVGPVENFAFFGERDKLVMVLLMWLGRLELYSVLALFGVSFWRR
jgi:trk system potassium uptake protein TrkH